MLNLGEISASFERASQESNTTMSREILSSTHSDFLFLTHISITQVRNIDDSPLGSSILSFPNHPYHLSHNQNSSTKEELLKDRTLSYVGCLPNGWHKTAWKQPKRIIPNRGVGVPSKINTIGRGRMQNEK